MYACSALHEATISSGCAAWPLPETTYCGFEPVAAAVDVVPVEEGGSVEGSVLYVYGRVVAVGREMKGETVRGTWASSGCASVGGACQCSGVEAGSCVGVLDTHCCRSS